MKEEVYNLQFPSWCKEITIFGYQFTRVDDYRDRLASLQHSITVHSEFEVCPNAGSNAVTAYVDLPEREEQSVLKHRDSDNTALSDILLLLSIFTSRDVFMVDNAGSAGKYRIFIADPRVYDWGGGLRLSIPYKNEAIPNDEPYGYDIGFEEGLNQAYTWIRSDDWQHKYDKGHYLILANMAFRCQPLETAFIQYWTICEHLFTLHNKRWLSDRQIRRLNPADKIAFLLVEYALKGEINTSENKRLDSLAEIRNRLVHIGHFPERDSVYDDAVLFIRLTEFIIAKTLRLEPSNVFNTIEELEGFLKYRLESKRG